MKEHDIFLKTLPNTVSHEKSYIKAKEKNSRMRINFESSNLRSKVNVTVPGIACQGIDKADYFPRATK